MRYTPHTRQDIGKMLDAIGAGGLDDLFCDIPEEVRLQRPLAIGEGMGEIELRAKLPAARRQTCPQRTLLVSSARAAMTILCPPP